MIKNNVLILVSLFLSQNLFANQLIEEKINIPSLRKKVKVTINTENGDYFFNPVDILNGKISIKENRDDSSRRELDCNFLEELLSGNHEGLSAKGFSYLDMATFNMKWDFLTFSEYDEKKIEQQIKTVIDGLGYSLNQLEDKTQIVLDDIDLSFEWNSKSLTLLSKQDVLEVAEKFLKEKAKENNFLYKAGGNNNILSNVRLPTLYCDIKSEKVKIRARLKGEQSFLYHTKSPISKRELSTLNNKLVNYNLSDVSNLRGDKLNNNEVRMIFAAGKMALELKSMGLESLMSSSLDVFVKLYEGLVSSVDFKFKKIDQNELDYLHQKTKEAVWIKPKFEAETEMKLEK